MGWSAERVKGHRDLEDPSTPSLASPRVSHFLTAPAGFVGQTRSRLDHRTVCPWLCLLDQVSLASMNSTNELSFPAPAHWINGRPAPVDGPTIDVVNPATGAVIATVPDGSAADVDRAVSTAAAAFPAWAATAVTERAAVLRRVAAGLR